MLTATTAAATTLGAYTITVTGVSGSVAETTPVCVEIATSSSATCSATGGAGGNFYVLNQTTNQIAALSISSGQLNSIGAVLLPAPLPLAIAVAPNGQFLYVSTANGIYLYAIGSGGALTLGNGGVAIAQDQASAMQVDSTNSWLVEAVSGTTQLYAINVISTGANAGTLVSANETKQPFTLPAATPTQLAISPGDSSSCGDCYVFVAMGAGGTEIINFNPSSANPFGASNTIGLANSGGGANTVAVDPRNRLLYVGESDAHSGTQTGGLRVFTIASTGVTPISGFPYATGGTGPISILPTADGNYVYVANQSVSGSSTDNIEGFSVTASSLTLVGTTAAGPTGRIGLAEDSTGSYLLAVDFAGNPDLEAYTMSSGTLTSVLSVATGTDPVGAFAIAAAP
jgi:6-phosphogluconolactonase (cycloisomerase 2 family)